MSEAAEAAARTLLSEGCFPADPFRALQRMPGLLFFTEEEMTAISPDCRLSTHEDARAFRCLEESGREKVLVCWREGVGESRLRFSFAHELGHLVLGHQSAFLHNIIEWETEKERRVRERQEEKEANAFAAAYLIPLSLLGLVVVKGGGEPEIVSAVFGVSKTAADLALRRKPDTIGLDLSQRVLDAFGQDTLRRLDRAFEAWDQMGGRRK
ncbi:MAG: ImmA/IrrE family metallo-endopeptidase [Clostridia bacterium]|nr:ImmA/IrrE family metallo-endopeptidase [Clostridia bacterium]